MRDLARKLAAEIGGKARGSSIELTGKTAMDLLEKIEASRIRERWMLETIARMANRLNELERERTS